MLEVVKSELNAWKKDCEQSEQVRMQVEGMNLKEEWRKTVIFESVGQRGHYKFTSNEKSNASTGLATGVC